MRALLVTLVLLAVLLVAADRVAVAVAEDQVGDRIAAQTDLPGAPDVDIAGFPFLTQAVAGRYDDVRLAFTAEDLGQPAGTRGQVSLRGVEVALSDVIGGSVAQIPVERIEGSATLSYRLLSDQIGPETQLERADEGLRISRTVELAGQQLDLSAAGTVSVEGGDLLIDVEEVSGAGVELPSAVVGQASDLLGLRYTLPTLPFGLELTRVASAADGVVVRAEGQGTVIGG